MPALDVIIVGAGLSGLTAAYKLKKEDTNIRLVVLEAKNRVGGRTLSTQLRASNGQTDVWDLGGQWVSSSQNYILSLLQDLKLETFPQYITGNKLLQVNGNQVKAYRSSIPKISFWAAIELNRFLEKVEDTIKQFSVLDPYEHPKAAEYDNMTFETLKNKNLKYPESRQLIDIAFRTTFGCEPCNLSCLYVMMYSKAAGSILRLFEATEGAAQQLRVKGGTQQISFLLKEKLGPETVFLSHPVIEIVQSELKESVTVYTSNGKTWQASRLILAIPIHEAIKISYRPTLPEPRRVLLYNMPIGHLTKFIVTYEKAFWRDKKLSGEIVSNGGFPLVNGCDTGPLGIVYDGTTHLDNPALVGFIAGHIGIQWSSKTPMERKGAVLQTLAYFFGNEALEPLEYTEKLWSEEPYNGGCPVNIVTTGMMKYYSKQIRMPFGRIHWAGTETATSWCGYMDGAVQAGMRAAKEVLHNFNPELYTDKDLEDTAYSKLVNSETMLPVIRRPTSLKKRAIIFVGVALITVFILSARRTYMNNQF